MPITKSAKKSWRASEAKRAGNKVQEIELEKTVKKVSASNISDVISRIDKAAKNHLISENKAARMKSRLTKKFGTPKVTKKATAPTKTKPKTAAKKKAAK